MFLLPFSNRVFCDLLLFDWFGLLSRFFLPFRSRFFFHLLFFCWFGLLNRFFLPFRNRFFFHLLFFCWFWLFNRFFLPFRDRFLFNLLLFCWFGLLNWFFLPFRDRFLFNLLLFCWFGNNRRCCFYLNFLFFLRCRFFFCSPELCHYNLSCWRLAFGLLLFRFRNICGVFRFDHSSIGYIFFLCYCVCSSFHSYLRSC